MNKLRYIRFQYTPNYTKQKLKVGIRCYDENNNPCILSNARSAQIININKLKYLDQNRVFTSRKEIKETAYMFIYKLYNIADQIAL